MFGKEIKKQNELIAQIKSMWENGHAEEMTDAYNNIVDVLGKLDMYSANILVNLIWMQTVQKTYLGTVGKKEVEIDG
jgi:formiminotetrahydrofolate cyclodeaminase